MTTLRNQRKAVTFRKALSKVVHVTCNKNDKDNVWISKNELTSYRKDLLRSLRHVQKYGFNHNNTNVCLRGMESLLNNGLTSGRRRLARSAVLRAQSMKDPEYVARIYKNYCNSAIETARTNAKKNEEEILG